METLKEAWRILIDEWGRICLLADLIPPLVTTGISFYRGKIRSIPDFIKAVLKGIPGAIGLAVSGYLIACFFAPYSLLQKVRERNSELEKRQAHINNEGRAEAARKRSIRDTLAAYELSGEVLKQHMADDLPFNSPEMDKKFESAYRKWRISVSNYLRSSVEVSDAVLFLRDRSVAEGGKYIKDVSASRSEMWFEVDSRNQDLEKIIASEK
jgi:hypothetical protein